MYKKVLIANRGAIACRIIRTLRKLGIKSVAVYSEVDRRSLHVLAADEAVLIGAGSTSSSYLSIDKILRAAKDTGAEAIHPGYGFLSEKPEFADACEAAGVAFIGPTGDQMRTFGLKHTARKVAAEMNLPLLPGTGLLSTLDEALTAAEAIGYPVMLKSTAGGGGIGIRLCQNTDDLNAAFPAVSSLGQNNFGDGGAFLEKYIAQARHIEVQIFGDGLGDVISLGERDCSAQRRNQKVIEETPAPGITIETREKLFKSAIIIGEAVNYRSAGTVEFIYDNTTGQFYFLEVNTRLQVEHGVTEEVIGKDLVEWMILQSSGDLQPLTTLTTQPFGHSIEVRIYAEDAGKNFQPSSGRLTHVEFPANIRTETWVEAGTEVTPFYDPMIAKLIVHADNRADALAKIDDALSNTRLYGIETNRDYLRSILKSPEFQNGQITTSFLASFDYRRKAVEVISGGTQTTVQDFPGRTGYWSVGVPPSGPMDSLSYRLANRLVGNAPTATALEITLVGPELRFGVDAVVVLTGAATNAAIEGTLFPLWTRIAVKAGSVLKVGTLASTGMRAYLTVLGGFDVGEYLGSRSTFMLGKFGGHDGRSLRSGDVVYISDSTASFQDEIAVMLPELVPPLTNNWTIDVLYGPHGAPDFFLQSDIEMLFSTSWKVHHQSDRTGIRLIGPKPKWARLDGGEAGLHPSNIHDNAYAIGAIDFTGDMPIILGPDGPSLGGFVCPAVIIDAELWKIGQLRPGDTVRFVPTTNERAVAQSAEMEETINRLSGSLRVQLLSDQLPTEPAIIVEKPEVNDNPSVVIRADGDRYLLIEFGPKALDLGLRLRIHSLESEVRKSHLPGIIDITAGVRSLQIHYDTAILSRDNLLEAVSAAEQAIPQSLDITVPSRIVHLPISWNDPQAQLAMRKYMETVRPDAPWCPDNIEFIRRINGLDSIDYVYKIIFDANYLVLGLGDVYLGAPVATPIDPRHRLVTTKYNPARTWTPENAVGIGGAYMCIYGMEGPGGYQLFGRTTQVWNTFKSTHDFETGTPWLLRHFDQIKFYPVTAVELLKMRDGFPHGDYDLKIEQSELRYRDYQAFLKSIEGETAISRTRQQAAFEAERARWEAAGQLIVTDSFDDVGALPTERSVPEGCIAVDSPMTSSVWKILVEPGQEVSLGDSLLILSAMKTETVVTATSAGRVVEILTKPDALVMHGQSLIILETAAP